MSNQITVAEAENMAGVSHATLTRFAEAGYFSVQTDAKGNQLYNRKELAKLFNIELEDEQEGSNEDIIAEVENTPKSEQTISHLDSVGRCSADYASPVSDNVENDTDSDPIISKEAESEQDASDQEDVTILPDDNFDIVDSSEQKLNDTQSKEVQKLKRVIELQDQLLDSRESEIQDLKNQRDWLQRRIEKAEEKAERDQLLMISEMQMLTKLVVDQSNKRSPIVSALEWLGLKDPPPTYQNNTIDYNTLRSERNRQNRSKDQAA